MNGANSREDNMLDNKESFSYQRHYLVGDLTRRLDLEESPFATTTFYLLVVCGGCNVEL